MIPDPMVAMFCHSHPFWEQSGRTPRVALRGAALSRATHLLILAIFVCGSFAVGMVETIAIGQETNPNATADDPPPTDDTESDELTDLPKFDTLTKPGFEELMKEDPVDWILLNQERVLRVEPVVPRPRTVEQLTEQIKKGAPRTGQTESEAAKKKRLGLYQLPVTLLEGEDREYTLHIKHIKGILYHEDLMLEQIDALLSQASMRKAYELLAVLEERDAEWPGIAPRRERILFVDAQTKFTQNRPQHALSLIESLHERNPTYQGLTDLFGKVTDRLITDAVAVEDFRQARFFLRRGTRMFGTHPIVVSWTERLTEQARGLLQQALKAESAGDRKGALDFAERTARVWPALQELVTPYGRINSRWQRLKVGVIDFPRSGTGDVALTYSDADLRRQQLTTAPLFQPVRVDDRIVRFRSRFLTEWEPLDLGHTVRLRLRPWQLSSDSQPLLNAFDLSTMLKDRMFPQNSKYDSRLGSMIERVEIDGPFDVSIHLSQVPLRPEVLLAIQAESHADSESSETPGEQTADVVPASGSTVEVNSTSFPFIADSTTADAVSYRRAYQQPDGLPEYHVAEVVERRFPNHESAIQGLLRGDVTMLPRIPLSVVRQFESRKEFFTEAYGLPTSHFLLLNHRKPALKLRSLRRALVYAIDRQKILQELLLTENGKDLGRLSSAPWATRSYAYSPLVPPHQYDTSLAFSLARTAEREFDSNLPAFRIFCPPDPEYIAACGQIIEAWRRIGVTATVVTPSESDAVPDPLGDDWDFAYRAMTLAEPAAELAPLLTHSLSTSVEAYSHLPAWLRRDLLELDRAGDWNVATQIMHRLHRQLWAEVELIPLWELDDRFVCRRNIRNLPERPVRPYQAVDRWRVDAWYPREASQ